MRNLCFFLLLCFSVLSCSEKEDDAQPKPQLNSYRLLYMDYGVSGSMFSPTNPLNLIKLEYGSDGKVLKRWNGLIPVNPNYGFGTMFFDGLYDEVVYQNNQIVITKMDTLKNLNVHPDRKIITMEYGKMVRFIRETMWYNLTYDTTWLYYNHETLFRTVTKNSSTILTKDYFFDNAGNLSEIKGLAIGRYWNDTAYFQTEKFSDYDAAPNPVKELGIFDETFNRSLSTNNYRRYTFQRFNRDSTLAADQYRNWTFVYDSNGNVKFDE